MLGVGGGFGGGNKAAGGSRPSGGLGGEGGGLGGNPGGLVGGRGGFGGGGLCGGRLGGALKGAVRRWIWRRRRSRWCQHLEVEEEMKKVASARCSEVPAKAVDSAEEELHLCRL